MPNAETQKDTRTDAQQKAADLTYHCTCKWLGGNQTRSETLWQTGQASFERRIVPYVIDADLPSAFTGSDYAAAPYEYLLHATASSLISTTLAYAARVDCNIDAISVQSQAAPFASSTDALTLDICVRPMNPITRRIVRESAKVAPVLRQLSTRIDLNFD